MNPTSSIKLINERFSQPQELAPNVFRAVARHKDRPVGVYYFDFSEAISDPNFDIKVYLQKTIAGDYYRNEGSLQWNYYLYFVLDAGKFQSLQKAGKVSEIELDRTFTRKFVRDEKWFAEDLKANLSASLHSGGQPQDLASYWLEELAKAGLGRIADTRAAYTTIVDEFIRGTERVASISKNAGLAQQTIPDGKHLEYLEIKNFRKFPSVRQFNFGKVNLIRGVNGSGKTSLLEAIELGICGGVRRQEGQNPANSSLLLGFLGEAGRVEAPVTDAGHYKNKDAQWYGGYYRGQNKLCENFGRFNFFDADAGFRLSHGKTGKEIQEAIEALFLGEYASSLETIMQSCLERFQTKGREFSERILRATSEQSKIEADLATVRKIKNTTETLSKELAGKCVSGGWLKLPDKMRQSELVVLEGNIGDACAQLKTAVRSVRWRSEISLKSLSDEQIKLKNADKEFSINETNKEKNAKSLGEMRELCDFLVAKLTLLQRLAAYHAEEEGFQLRGLEEATESRRIRYDELKEAAAQSKTIELSAFEKNTAMFADAFKELDANIASRKKQVNQKKRRIDELRKQFGEIKSLVEQIRGLGRHFCESNPGVKECPVCGAEYDAGLLKRIENAKATASMDNSLRELVSEAAAGDKQLAGTQEQRASLEQLRDAALIIFDEEILGKKSVKFVAAELATVNAKVVVAKSELDSASATAKRLKLRGFTETELASLVEEAGDSYELSQNQITKPNVLNALIESDRRRHDTLKKDISNAEKAKKQFESESTAVVKKALGSSDFDEPLVEIEKRIAAVNNALALAKDAKDTFTLQQEDEFSMIHNKLKIFGEAVARIRESLKQVEEKDELEKKWATALEASKAVVGTNKPKNERVVKAVDVLERLLNGKNKSEYLNGIIDGQRKRLVELFKTIHAPQEFDGVKFNGDIYLNRRGGGASRLSEISTGQRSALALSIFLSMNSSVGQKAPWLIFDDPIAHIDDLNVLSFLDSLRELVINDDRQMFFATANSKVANLFARKFDFLGDSFREIALNRAEG